MNGGRAIATSLLLACVRIAAVEAPSGAAPGDGPPPSATDVADRHRRAADGPQLWFRPTLKLSMPLLASIGVEAIRPDPSTDALFPVVSGDVGIGGGALAAGIGWGGIGGFGYHAVKATALRTWGAPVLAKPGRTYVGVAYQLAPVFYAVSIGPAVRVGAGRPEVIVAASIGLAF